MRYLMMLFMLALLPLPALAADTITFDFADGARWVSIEGDVSDGTFAPVYVAGGNSNASSGQDCAGGDNSRCFLALTLAWSNAYSNATGPSGFVLTSTDGAVRLSCSRGPVVVAGQAVPMAVHSCSTAWQSGAVWSAPTTCDGPQGADLGGCVGYAFEQAARASEEWRDVGDPPAQTEPAQPVCQPAPVMVPGEATGGAQPGSPFPCAPPPPPESDDCGYPGWPCSLYHGLQDDG